MAGERQADEEARGAESLESSQLGFDVDGATDSLQALHALSGLDAVLFVPTLEDDGSKGARLLYSTDGCARCCPRCLKGKSAAYWSPECLKRHLSAAMLADRHGGKYAYVCPENKIFISAPVMSGRVLRAAIILGPTDVSEEDDEEPQRYPGFDPYPVRNSEAFHHLTVVLAAVAAGVGDGSESYLRRVGREDKLDAKGLARSIERSRRSRSTQYPVASERALGAAVHSGDSAAAVAALDRIFSYFATAGSHTGAHEHADQIGELIVIISRSALGAGVQSGIVFAASEQCKRELAFTSTHVQSYRRVRFLVDEMIAFVNSVKGEAYDDLVYRVQAYVQEHLGEELRLERVGEAVGLSPAYLSRVFKEKSGQNFVEYVNQMRIARAKGELLGDDASIAEISRACGFESVSYFTRVFKKSTGITPGAFRKSRGLQEPSSAV